MKIFLIFYFCLFTFCIYGQQVCKGNVKDKTTHLPIPNSSVTYTGKTMGTIANTDGDFVIPFFNTSTDTLLITCIGYKTLKISTVNLNVHNPLLIQLEQQSVELEEVIVLSESPNAFLKRMSANSVKHLYNPVMLETYYREFVKKNGQFSRFSDGILNFYLENKGKKKIESIYVLQSRAKEAKVEAEEGKDVDMPPIFGPDKIADFYYVQRSMIKFTDSAKYDINIKLAKGKESQDYYILEVTPKPDIKEPLSLGKIFIDKSSSIITRVEMEVPESNRPYLPEINVLIVREKISYRNIILEYRIVGEKCYLKYAKINYGLHIYDKKKTNLNFDFRIELLTYNANYNQVKPYDDKPKYTKNTLYKHGTDYNNEFWKSYGVIVSTDEEIKMIESMKEKK